MRTRPAGSPRVPASSQSAQGESAPKARPKGVADGNPVNIPEPLSTAKEGRRRVAHPGAGSPGSSVYLRRVGKSARLNGETRVRAPKGAKWVTPDFQEKLLSIRSAATVPETNTGGQGEHPKALGELG